jgi:hypothetical protein
MNTAADFDGRLGEALREHASQERAYDELLAVAGLTREAVARAGEGRFLAPGRRALLAAARSAADEASPEPSREPGTVPPHAVPV